MMILEFTSTSANFNTTSLGKMQTSLPLVKYITHIVAVQANSTHAPSLTPRINLWYTAYFPIPVQYTIYDLSTVAI